MRMFIGLVSIIIGLSGCVTGKASQQQHHTVQHERPVTITVSTVDGKIQKVDGVEIKNTERECTMSVTVDSGMLTSSLFRKIATEKCLAEISPITE